MFRVRQKVVCVDAGDHDMGTWWPGEAPIKGAVYTISAMVVDAFGEGLCFEELERHPEVRKFWDVHSYSPHRFRPVVDRPTDISIFTAMLREASLKEKV